MCRILSAVTTDNKESVVNKEEINHDSTFIKIYI